MGRLTDIMTLSVPWDKSDALSQLSLAINLDPTNGQPCIFPGLWNVLPYSWAGLKAQYTADKEGVNLTMPDDRTNVAKHHHNR